MTSLGAPALRHAGIEATTRRFLNIVQERCLPAVRNLGMFDVSGLELADEEVAAELLRNGRGQAYVTPEQDILIYQPVGFGFCGVVSDPVRRLRAVHELSEWAQAQTPAFTATTVEEDDIHSAWIGPHPERGQLQILLSFEAAGDSAAHLTAAWVTEDA
ncbi:MAG: hypothetical protein AAFQ73_14265 [Pseudomonadota bacterium]